MKVFIQSDIEGVAGVIFFENRSDKDSFNTAHRLRMCKLLTDEVNAAVKAAFDCGADEVLVNDNHGSGYNIIFEELDPRCEIIHGRSFSGQQWLPFIQEFDAMALVGMHAMTGTENASIPHSKWVVNDGEYSLSEASMAAAVAGKYDIPTVFVSGDDKITAELKEKIPEIRVAAIKRSLSCYLARSVIPERACQMIYEGVKEGLLMKDKIKPFKINGPVSLHLVDSDQHTPPYQNILEHAATGKDIEEAMKEYNQRLPWSRQNKTLPDGFTYP